MSFVEFKNVTRFFTMGSNVIKASDGVDFTIEEGEFCVIVGPSGAGKTTVLNMLGGMDSVTGGEIYVDGTEISSYNEKRLTLYRRYDVGFVFQFYNLIQNLTALENVEIASEICKDPLDAKKTLEQVGLAERMNNFPAQLSGGEQQRVSIARAIAKNPKLLLCDEPTGALDYETGKNILKLLHDVCRENKKTVIVITHNQAITRMADRVIHIKNGKVSSEETVATPEDVSRIEW
ncbi:MAG TPA: ABC transporter ATP-binding protein [Candidatus Borkfalkia avistercoris]|uniref:ABC transporter ATP-binding protein n=1 Tax=Candidatus Borkfalkia avistercoris TaxID=2838504 RepID=A0A9D2D089_9FIRM|nr:ABC transporter ATP-binding protein [Candidatus Borkfalkia avistercoris]